MFSILYCTIGTQPAQSIQVYDAKPGDIGRSVGSVHLSSWFVTIPTAYPYRLYERSLASTPAAWKLWAAVPRGSEPGARSCPRSVARRPFPPEKLLIPDGNLRDGLQLAGGQLFDGDQKRGVAVQRPVQRLQPVHLSGLPPRPVRTVSGSRPRVRPANGDKKATVRFLARTFCFPQIRSHAIVLDEQTRIRDGVHRYADGHGFGFVYRTDG